MLPEREVRMRLDGLAQYQEVAEKLFAEVGNVSSGQRKLELEERLTSLLLAVDAVETAGHGGIRTARKRVVFVIQNALTLLENGVVQA